MVELMMLTAVMLNFLSDRVSILIGLSGVVAVDCIDYAADVSVVSAVNEGIDESIEIFPLPRPWVMISVNDDEDLHFRKAEFDAEDCPLDCSRPCERVCPTDAISFEAGKSTTQHSYGTNTPAALKARVLIERCYGCGRCIPVCPYDKISVSTYIRDATATSELLKRNDVDAIEIHTSGRQIAPFKELWDGLGDSIRHLRLAAVSLPDLGESTVSTMKAMYSIMEPDLSCFNLWQHSTFMNKKLNGRPMSGDIGRGATRESIAFALRLAAIKERPRGFLQLAGGTNAHTVDGMRKVGLFQTASFTKNTRDENSTTMIGGVAYGGYARKIVGRILSSLQLQHDITGIEDYPEHLLQALREALALVGKIKCYKSI
ncbi:hypothetical protein M0R45_008580 [Rubus argutus]|uniref:4Fe-4S ferredoxin-type domain-containing protein n=1 Tax=Rubus argutus TaxID=59490 RepID=A0AAW1Y206_RUBAR